MKNRLVMTLGFGLTLLLFHINAMGQDFNIHNPIDLPKKSQQAEVTQRIGYTDIRVAYHSPGARGRKVWGEMVPYGKVWRAGANENTVITLSHEVRINGQQLAAGSYGLHLLPEEEEWTFVFSKNHTSWGSYFYDEDEDVLRVTVPVVTTKESREWLSYEFVKRERSATTIVLRWADKKATLNLSLDINEIALDHIRKQLRSDAYWEWYSWCQAADYCAEYGINTEEAITWIDHSIALRENFSNWDVKAKLLRQLGDEKGAEASISKAMEVGNVVYLERYGRRFLNKKEYEQAVSIFEKAIKKDKTYWRAHFNKGNAFKGMGRNKEAKKAFQAALKYAPANQKSSIERSLKALVAT